MAETKLKALTAYYNSLNIFETDKLPESNSLHGSSSHVSVKLKEDSPMSLIIGSVSSSHRSKVSDQSVAEPFDAYMSKLRGISKKSKSIKKPSEENVKFSYAFPEDLD